MKFDWDEAKRLANIRKHDIDFADVAAVFDSDHVLIDDDRFDYSEGRFLIIGLLFGVVVAVAFTERQGDTVRLISARKATKREASTYFAQFRN